MIRLEILEMEDSIISYKRYLQLLPTKEANQRWLIMNKFVEDIENMKSSTNALEAKFSNEKLKEEE